MIQIEKFNISENNEYQVAQSCFNALGLFIVILDFEGNILLVNQRGSKILGFEVEKIKGKNFLTSFINQSNRYKLTNILDNLRNKEKSVTEVILRIQNARKEEVLICADFAGLKDSEENINGFLISGQKLDRRKKITTNTSLIKKIAKKIPEVNIFLFDEQSTCILAEGSDILDQTINKDDIEEKNINEIPVPELKTNWKKLLKETALGKDTESEYFLNGKLYLVWAFPIKNDAENENSSLIITCNLPEEKRIETYQVNLVKEKEQNKNNQEMNQFLERISHELRTPLNAIQGFTEQLKQTETNNRQKKFLDIIDTSSDHLINLLNDALVLTKIQTRQIYFDKTAFNLQSLINHVFETLRPQAEEKKLELSLHISKNVHNHLSGDAFRLKQILVNLVNNAIKFTHEGRVTLSCEQKDETDTMVKTLFKVSDTGIGIEKENLAIIFKQFHQLESSETEQITGTGLGLTICKNMIEMQNGKIWVESEVNKGTTFSFWLPFEKTTHKATENNVVDKIDPNQLKHLNILLVDDDSVNRLLGKVILEKFNCSFDIATNGHEALNRLEKNNYDIVLLDIHMPDINGIEVAKHFRHNMGNKKTKIIALTAAVISTNVEKYFDADINDVLFKPYREIYLYNKICSLLDIESEFVNVQIEEHLVTNNNPEKNYSFDNIIEMTGNDQKILLELIMNFIENSEAAMIHLRDGMKKNDWKRIGESAHKLIPSYKHLQVKEIIPLLLELKKKTLIERDYTGLKELLSTLDYKMERLLHHLRNDYNKIKFRSILNKP